ncbi:MAG: hypothetical protein M3M88_03055 [Thermoproteota archaeon]|nr:hypothetical protein [Thermoproteota archaeon]
MSTLKMMMNDFSLPILKNNKYADMVLIGVLFVVISQSLSLEMLGISSDNGNNIFQQSLAAPQQPTTNSSPINKNMDSQSKSENMMQAAGHFANNQIRDGVVTWIQGGYWNLQIVNVSDKLDNNEQIGNTNNTANFLANFTMIRPDGSLSHNHIINNFSSNNVVLSDNDVVVTGMADILSNNGLEYKQVPLIVHLMGKKVLGLTIDVGKTEGHFASPNEMFGTLISGVGINSSNLASTTTMMNHEEPAMSNDSLNNTPMTMMKH